MMMCFYTLLLSKVTEVPGGTLANTPIAPSLVPFKEEETDMTEVGMKGTFPGWQIKT